MRRRRQSNVDWETKLSGGDMDDGDDGGVPGAGARIECGNPFLPFIALAKHLSTRSSTAMDSAANPRERVRARRTDGAADYRARFDRIPLPLMRLSGSTTPSSASTHSQPPTRP